MICVKLITIKVLIALGSIALHSALNRDIILSLDVFSALVPQIPYSSNAILRRVSFLLLTLCRGDPKPHFNQASLSSLVTLYNII